MAGKSRPFSIFLFPLCFFPDASFFLQARHVFARMPFPFSSLRAFSFCLFSPCANPGAPS
ncbi:MAG: hypothetical protein NTX79_03180 [Candidatus Micrarchaeota archaeon]|nr:hypothetical protein [Candidatus Micrarchaeota archaeon]